MENQEYLNQISVKTTPPAEENGWLGKVMHSKFALVGIIGVSLLVLVMILGMILGGGKGGEKYYAVRLKLHIDNTSELIDEYQPSVKSSDLRSYSASLRSLLLGIGVDVSSFLLEKYSYKNDKNADKELVADAELQRDSLNADLFEAKINGNLDRIFAHKMAYEVSVFLSEEEQLSNAIKDETLIEQLNTSHSSLENIYSQFNNFSEAK